MLLSTKVTRYLEFKSVGGSYVVQGGKPQKVPSTPREALSTPLLGLLSKRRFKNFLEFVGNYKEEDAKTHEGVNLNTTTCAALFKKYSLDTQTQAFTGHAMALYLDDTYLTQPAKEMVERIKLYVYSMSRYGNSPYIYPVWGLGGLPEGFSR
jgi:Rab GDP dissociation inhibitor